MARRTMAAVVCIALAFAIAPIRCDAEFVKQPHPWSGGHEIADNHLLADFNGDGMTDLLLVGGEDPGSRYSVQVWLSNGSSFEAPQVWGHGFMPAIWLRFGDFNGDGRTDVINFRQGNRRESDGGMEWSYKARVWLSTGNSFSGPVQWSRADFWHRADSIGDFDGDGKTDVIDVQNGTAYFYSSRETSFQVAQEWGSGIGYRLLVLDADGDGTDDLVEHYGNGSATLWLSRKKGLNRQPPSDLGGAGAGCLPGHRIGDFDGDGRDDVMTIDHHANAWVAYISLSAGTTLRPGALWGSGFDCDVSIGDFNGDGRADLLSFTDPSDWTNAEARVWLSSGTAFQPGQTWSGGHRNWGKLGDFNGDGKTDFAQWANFQSWIWLGR